jgi:hypothetical protein
MEEAPQIKWLSTGKNYRKRFGPGWINYLWGEQKEFISLLLSLDILVYII